MDNDAFVKSINGKKIPILTLDQKWHRLFAIHGKTDEIKSVEQELNELLKKQGELNNEIKELKKLKSQLMGNIVENMDGAAASSENSTTKKLETDKRLIDDINNKLDDANDALLEIPAQIKDVNEHLMLLSMDYFYDKIRVNQSEADEIEAWINQVRIDLKKNIIRKQNRDINNREIYAYLHDILGHEVLDLFDIEYDKLGASE